MTSPTTGTQPPEASGPGTPDDSGGVAYGEAAEAGARAFVPPPVPAEQRDANMAAYRNRCDRCAAVPDEVITAWRQALADAKAGRIT